MSENKCGSGKSMGNEKLMDVEPQFLQWVPLCTFLCWKMGYSGEVCSAGPATLHVYLPPSAVAQLPPNACRSHREPGRKWNYNAHPGERTAFIFLFYFSCFYFF